MEIELAQEFPLHEELIYLNHAGVAPWPRRTAEAVQRFAMENVLYGAQNYSQWEQQEALLREQLRQLLNAPLATDIALLKNTSEALSVVAYGWPWQKGDNIVILQQEFPSNRIVWESLANQGVTVRSAQVSAENPESDLFAQVDEHTRLMAVSSVHYARGLRLDLAKIGAFCQTNQILFGVDAIQSLGALSLDVQAINADFVMADGHKWMLGPEGLAVFYCKAERREQLQLKQFGWHMVEDFHHFDAIHWRVASSARRFECGSPNQLGIQALSASLSLLSEVGLSTITEKVLDNSQYLMQALAQIPDIIILSPQQPGRYAGIVTFRHREIATADLLKDLYRQGVICAQRGGGVRFSPHFYTPRAKLDKAISLVNSGVKKLKRLTFS